MNRRAAGTRWEPHSPRPGRGTARLVRPLTDTRAHLRPEDAELAERIDALTRHTDQLRQDTRDQRST
ncbi:MULTISPECIES: hypothetical protein [unclassified Streptomyces]|uniref:hypothetical protein n=1 Tax=unclassified Streptomyces TaxID=2593676 RepID=UPI002883B3B3|nr:hypothetical protein [Streptomyces sp. DSM 41633]